MVPIKQLSIHRKVNHDIYRGRDNYDFAESHDEFVDRVTQEINNLDRIKVISVNYVNLSKEIRNISWDEEVAVITYV